MRRDLITEARLFLGTHIGNGIEYRKYCNTKLAGDFAAALVEYIHKIKNNGEGK